MINNNPLEEIPYNIARGFILFALFLLSKLKDTFIRHIAVLTWPCLHFNNKLELTFEIKKTISLCRVELPFG